MNAFLTLLFTPTESDFLCFDRQEHNFREGYQLNLCNIILKYWYPNKWYPLTSPSLPPASPLFNTDFILELSIPSKNVFV